MLCNIKMSAVKTWTVVLFLEENTVEAVPTHWIKERKNGEFVACWPPFSGDILKNAIRNSDEPNSNWNLYPCRLFKSGTFGKIFSTIIMFSVVGFLDDYQLARSKSRKAEGTSELSSDSNATPKRKPKPVRRSASSSDEDSETSELPKPPAPPKKVRKVAPPMDVVRASTPHSQLPISGLNYHVSKQSQPVSPVVNQNMNLKPGNSEPTISELESDTELEAVVAESASTSMGTSTSHSICTCCRHVKNLVNLFELFVRKQNIQKGVLAEVRKDVIAIHKKIQAASMDHLRDIEDQNSMFKTLDLPIMDPANVDTLEDYLTDENNMKLAKIEIARIGGDDPGDFIRRALSRLLDDNVLKTRNWEGGGRMNKLPFKTLKTVELLFGGLEISQKITDENLATKLIKNYLKNAKDRAAKKA